MKTLTSRDWRHERERSNLFFLKLMVWVSLRLGRTLSRGVLVFITLYFLAFAPKARRSSRDYLHRALQRTPSLLDQFRHFYAFASTVHDRIYLLNDRFDLFDIEVVGAERVLQTAKQVPGVLLVGAHLGSFEVMRSLGKVGKGPAGFQLAMLMYEANAQKINATLHAINPLARHDIVALGQWDSMLKIHERLDSAYVVGLMADRFLDENGQLINPFLGHSAAFPLGPWRAAAMLRRPVFLMVGLYLGGNRYRIQFEPLADFSQVQRTQRPEAIEMAARVFAERLTHFCRIAPYNWFNFFDFWEAR